MRVAATEDGTLPAGTAGDDGRAIGEFLIARGGPFYDLQVRLGLLREQALHAGRRAAILVGIAWGVSLVLSALTGHALGLPASRPFLLDLGAWARFSAAGRGRRHPAAVQGALEDRQGPLLL